METFSQRLGFTPRKTAIQRDSMDDDLRNSLWNALTAHHWGRLRPDRPILLSEAPPVFSLFRRLWVGYFKLPIDTLPNMWPDAHEKLRDHFFASPWHEVYSLIEFVANINVSGNDDERNRQFRETCNTVLKGERAGWRFVGNLLAPITSEEEIAAIEQAQSYKGPLAGVREHMRTAVACLADKKRPDYRNCIKEAVLAVEAVCRAIVGRPKATLPEALARLEGRVELHGALKTALEKLYGFSSDAEGIRHALSDAPTLDQEDARFMLVASSAFVHYLVEKAGKAGIRF